MDIHGDKLLRFLGPNRGDRGQEVDKFLGVVSLSVEEIQTVLDFFAVDKSAKFLKVTEDVADEPTCLLFLYERNVSG